MYQSQEYSSSIYYEYNQTRLYVLLLVILCYKTYNHVWLYSS